jgi:hypothetical protein
VKPAMSEASAEIDEGHAGFLHETLFAQAFGSVK